MTSTRISLSPFLSTDSAFLVNRGIISVLEYGIQCEQYCHILNENLIELEEEGFDLIPNNRLINKGTIEAMIQSGRGIDIGSSEGASYHGDNQRQQKSSEHKAVMNHTVHNWPGAEITFTGDVMGPNDPSNADGIQVFQGNLLNEGTINLMNLSTALRVSSSMSIQGPHWKNNVPSNVTNEGTINIVDSKIGIIGNSDGNIINNGVITGNNLWICPLEMFPGFEFNNYGEFEFDN